MTSPAFYIRKKMYLLFHVNVEQPQFVFHVRKKGNEVVMFCSVKEQNSVRTGFCRNFWNTEPGTGNQKLAWCK